MEQYKRLLGNIGLLTLSNFATKILTFLLVPLYTSILTTEEYGTFDLVNTCVLLSVPILTVSIQEGILRFALEKNADKKSIFSIGLKIFFFSSAFMGVVILLNSYLKFNVFLDNYGLFFYLMYISNSLGGIVSYYIRGLGEIKYISIGSCLSVAVTIFLNILFLIGFKMGISGYFYATIIGHMIPIIYYFFHFKLWHFFDVSCFSKKTKLETDMLRYSVPMIANTISWWVNGAADRLFVTFFCGIGANGIYSVAHKIPTILATFQNIFAQAWSISAVQDFESSDKKGFYSNTYNTYNMLLVIVCSGIILLDKFLSKLLFAKEFYLAWELVPFLVISTLFSGLSGYLGGILSALKKTDTFAKTSVLTAFINIVLNLVLIPNIGSMGAGISTAIAFFIMWFMRLRTVRKYISLRVDLIKSTISYVIVLLQAILIQIEPRDRIFSTIQLVLFVGLNLLYINTLYNILRNFFYKIVKKKK